MLATWVWRFPRDAPPWSQSVGSRRCQAQLRGTCCRKPACPPELSAAQDANGGGRKRTFKPQNPWTAASASAGSTARLKNAIPGGAGPCAGGSRISNRADRTGDEGACRAREARPLNEPGPPEAREALRRSQNLSEAAKTLQNSQQGSRDAMRPRTLSRGMRAEQGRGDRERSGSHEEEDPGAYRQIMMAGEDASTDAGPAWAWGALRRKRADADSRRPCVARPSKPRGRRARTCSPMRRKTEHGQATARIHSASQIRPEPGWPRDRCTRTAFRRAELVSETMTPICSLKSPSRVTSVPRTLRSHHPRRSRTSIVGHEGDREWNGDESAEAATFCSRGFRVSGRKLVHTLADVLT